MSKILIIGAASGLGASIAASILQNTQHTVITVDDLRVERDLRNLQFSLSHKKGDRHKFYLTQVCDPHIATKLFELEKPDIAIFCKTPEKTSYHQSLVRTLVEAKAHGTKVVYIVPDSWSESRNESYTLGVEICKSDSNSDFSTVLYAGRVYGPRQEAGDPLVQMMADALSGHTPVGPTISTQPKEWIYIKDVLTAVEAIINAEHLCGQYHVGSGQVASEFDVAMMLGCIIQNMEYNIPRHNYSCTSTSELENLGWESKYRLREALEHTLSWYAVNKWATEGEVVVV